MVTIDLVLKKLKLSNAKVIHNSGGSYAAAVRNADMVDLHNNRVINILEDQELKRADRTISGSLFVVGTDIPEYIYSNMDMVIISGETITVQELLHEINRIIADYEKYCVYAGRLYMISNAGANWSEIFNLFAEYYDNLVCFGDSSGNVIFSANMPEEAAEKDETICQWRQYGYVPKEFAKDNKNLVTLKKVFESEIPVVLNQEFSQKYRRLAYRSCMDYGIYSHYFSIIETTSKFGYFDRDFLTDVGDLVSSLYSKHQIHEIERPRNALFRDLTEGIIKEEAVLKNKMKNCYLPLDEYYRIIYLSYDITREGSLSNVDRMHLKNSLDNNSPPFINFCGSNYIAVLLVGKTREIIEDIQQKLLKEYLEKEKFLAGFSSIYRDLLKSQIKLKEAKLSLKTGKIFYPQRQIYEFDQLYVEIMIHFAAERDNMDLFLSDSLLKLKDYDQQRNTEYYKTLYEFILCRGSINRLCEKMSIHKNTAIYRVNKIKEIIESDLGDFNELIQLYLSFLVFQFKQSKITE